MIELFSSLQTLGNPEGMLAFLVGTFMGFIFGILPGIGQGTILILLIPFCFTLSHSTAFILLASALGSTTVGGSMTCIILNTPGTVGNLTTMLDGYPMARKGEAGRAIGNAAGASLVGGIFGIIVLMLSIPLVRKLIHLIGARENFWLVILALIIVALSSPSGAFLKGLAAGAIGLLFSFIGFDNVSGITRFSGDSIYLWNGIYIAPLVVGVYALSEMTTLQATGLTIAGDNIKAASLFQSIHGAWESIKSFRTWILSSVIGTIIGIIPGIGAATATYASYGTVKLMSKDGHSFGHGNIKGIIASEAANNAKDGGSLLPTLFFGIPGSPEMAILLGGFIIFGIFPGPAMAYEHLNLAWLIILGVLLSNMLACIFAIIGSPLFSRITTISVSLVLAISVPISLASIYAARGNPWDYLATLLFAILGIAMKRVSYPIGSLIIGWILGPLAEKSFYITLQSNYYNPVGFYNSPFSITLMAIVLLLLILPLILTLRKYLRIKRRFSVNEVSTGRNKVAKIWNSRINPYELILTIILLGIVLAFLLSSLSYDYYTALFPRIVGGAAFLFLIMILISQFPIHSHSLFQSKLGPAMQENNSRPVQPNIIEVAKVLGWLTGLILLTLIVGTILANFIGMLFLLRCWPRMKWVSICAIGVINSFVIYGMFKVLFDIPLWTGAITKIIPNILGGGTLPPL